MGQIQVEQSPVGHGRRSLVIRAGIIAVVLAAAVAVFLAVDDDDVVRSRPAGLQTPAGSADDAEGSKGSKGSKGSEGSEGAEQPAVSPATTGASTPAGAVSSPAGSTGAGTWTEDDMKNAKPYDNSIEGDGSTSTTVEGGNDTGAGSTGGGQAP